jgi:hypothetical protein
MASIEIAPGWIDAVQAYIEGLMVNSITAAENATKLFREKVVETARQDEDWTSIADNITLWSQDGHLVIGVHDPLFVSQAALLEYGDAEHAPNPMLRTLTSASRDASSSMRSEMESHYGPSMSVGGPRVQGMFHGS